MGQNVGDWAKNDEKSKKGTKRQKSLPKMADFCHFFPSNRGKQRDQAFIEGQTPPSPLLYHHLSQKKKKKTKKKLIYSMQFMLQTWGQLKTLSFPGPNRKRSVIGGHF